MSSLSYVRSPDPVFVKGWSILIWDRIGGRRRDNRYESTVFLRVCFSCGRYFPLKVVLRSPLDGLALRLSLCEDVRTLRTQEESCHGARSRTDPYPGHEVICSTYTTWICAASATSGFTTASIVQSSFTTGANFIVKKSTGKTITQHALENINKEIMQQTWK